jgi:type I restriction enzyme, S subunit
LKFHLRGSEQGWSPQCDNVPAEEDEWGVLKAGCVNGWEFNPNQNKRLPADLEPVAEYEVQERDVIMSRANTRELLGSASIAKNIRSKLMLSDKLYRLDVDETYLTKEYLIMFLAIPVGRYEFERDASGASSSMQNISQDTVRNMWLPIPPIHEQAEITDYISSNIGQINAIQEATKQSVELLKERRSALITAAVTGQLEIEKEYVD